jgi:hypothetical protein
LWLIFEPGCQHFILVKHKKWHGLAQNGNQELVQAHKPTPTAFNMISDLPEALGVTHF